MLAREEIDAIASTIAKAFRPEKIIMFGSHARGEAGENSDLDLLVVTRQIGPRGKRSAPIIRALAERHTAPVDVVVRSQESLERWRDTPGTLAHQIALEGVVLYEKPRRQCRRIRLATKPE